MLRIAIVEDEKMMCPPHSQILNVARKLAAIPDDVSIAALPPSIVAILEATVSDVGF